MDPAVLRRTQETLGRVIRKPQLSEKYLNKPPFRFLHDIISEVIRATGFMKGLYSEHEMKSENIKDRDSKMSYLQKAIDVVVLVTGEALSVKPARVVAGQEPEKTNELLQIIAQCCLSKFSSDEAVRTVLSDKPDNRQQERENEPRGAEGKTRRAKPDEPREKQKNGESDQRHKGEKERERREKKEEKRGEEREKRGEERERRNEREKKGEEREKREKKEEKREERERREDREKRGEERERKEKKETRGEERERRGESREKSKEKVRSTDREREREPHRKEERERERDRHREREKEKEKEKEKERRRRERDQDGTMSHPREEPHTQVKTEEPPQNTSPEEPPKPVAESSARIPRPSSAKGQRRRAKVGSQDESDSEGDAEVTQKPPESSTEPPALTETAPSRRMVRPSSARPAPPRVKRQESHAESPAERLPSAKVSAVILDGGRRTEEDEDDEDKQFLVQEAVAAAAEAPDPHAESTEATGDATHGGLVKKILETKKYYEVSEAKAQQGQVQQGQVQQGLVQREMERLRASVQSVCRNALPLGKIMDYFQEDVDTMMTEVQQWRQENKQHAQALQEQHRLTEGALQPLRTELMELESLIQEQKAQTCALRCSVLKNEEKIHKMLTGLHQQN